MLFKVIIYAIAFALESVLGNVRIEDFSAITGVNDISCIGFLADEFNSNLYLFFTNYSELNLANPSYSPSSNNFIFAYNTLSEVSTLLVEGSFLNFSKTNPIYGVNLLENLLFWTDNRNQPRKQRGLVKVAVVILPSLR